MNGTQFLDAFFSPPNFTWGQIAPAADALEPALHAVRAGLPAAAYLPARSVHGSVLWYGLTDGEAKWPELAEISRHAIDPSWGRLATVTRPTPRDAVEHLIQEFTRGGWIALEVKEVNKQAGREALMRLVENLQRRPPVALRLKRSVGRVISDLDLAVSVSDHAAVDRLLDELDHSHLSAENRTYVRLDTLHRLGQHDEVMSFPDLGRVLEGLPPRNVRLAAMGSLWHRLADGLGMLTPATTCDPALASTLVTLLETAPPVERREHVETLLLAHHRTNASAPGDWAEPSHLLAKLDALGLPTQDWVRALGVVEATEPLLDPMETLDTMAAAARDPAEVHRVFQFAMGLATLEAARVAYACVQDVAPELLDGFIGRALLGLFGESPAPTESSSAPMDPVVASWTDWLDRCAQGSPWPDAHAVAEQRSADWTLTSTDVTLLVDAIESLDEYTIRNLRAGLGRVIAATEPTDTSATRRVLLAAIQLVAHLDDASHDERDSVLWWIDQIFVSGVGADDYQTLLTALQDIWVSSRSLTWLDWVIDVLDLLACNPVPDGCDADRAEFTTQVFVDAQRWRSALDASRRRTLQAVASDSGIDATGLLPEDGGEVDPLTELGESLLGIYTLSESVAHAAKRQILSVAPRCTVEVSHDHQASEQLTALAERADIFIMVSGSAQHAATDAIRKARPDNKPLLKVTTKGHTSMLRELRAFLEQRSA